MAGRGSWTWLSGGDWEASRFEISVLETECIVTLATSPLDGGRRLGSGVLGEFAICDMHTCQLIRSEARVCD
jgi:hypothetical protein